MPKALVERDGRLLVERGHTTLRDGGCDPIVVVLGAAAQEARRRARLMGAMLVVNPQWATGMGSSLRAGLAALSHSTVEAVIVLLVDTPGVTAAAVRRVAISARPDALIVATYHNQPGHPVLLGRNHWPQIATMAVGDTGARPFLRAHPDLVSAVPCDDIAEGEDRDFPSLDREHGCPPLPTP
jgi:nicotine blue oxidoreductase